jgi:predicted Zn-dependent protease
MTLTDEQEYLLGRQVAADLLARFPPVKAPFNKYSTTLARYLAQFSKRPTTFKGYRAQLIQSSEKSAFSTPGGFIFISQPLLKALNNEDELAGVIAHEISHVVLRHGELAMRKSTEAKENREKTAKGLKAAANVLGGIAGSAGDTGLTGAAQSAEVASIAYDNGAGKIHEQLLKSGYSQDQEYAADAMALRILLDAGYDPKNFGRFLSRTFSSEERIKKKGLVEGTLLSTHPLDEKRVDRINKMIIGWRPGPASKKRLLRFQHIKNASLPRR